MDATKNTGSSGTATLEERRMGVFYIETTRQTHSEATHLDEAAIYLLERLEVPDDRKKQKN